LKEIEFQLDKAYDVAEKAYQYNLLWSSFFVTLLANKIELFRTNTSAVSATLDNAPAGWMLSSLRL